MTIQRYIWMLSEFGQVAELPAGTCPVDALPTGPLYERLLRSQPPVKLLYTHAQGSNVNDVATVLAGHTINGDACLVAACSSLAAHPTSHAALLSALLDDLLPSPTNTQHPQPQPQPHVHRRRLIRTLLAGALDSTSTPPVEPQVSCPVSPQDSDSRDQLPAQPSHPSHPSPRYLPGGTSSGLHPQYAAMRAILGSKNATPNSTASAAAVATGLTASSDALCTMASAAEEEGEGEEQEQEGIDTGAEGGSLKLHNNDMDMSEGGQVNIDKGVDAKEYLYERATYESDSGSSGGGMVPQPPSDPRNRLRPDSGVASPRCKSARSDGGGDTSTAAAAVGALWPEAMMAEVEAGREMETKMEGAEGMWIEPEASGEGQMQLQEAQEQCAAVQVLEVLAAAQWAELAADVVASIALHLPQRASQLLAMSAVCRGWRAALLDHRPLLARITFNLDLTPPHCQAEGAGGGTSAARRTSLTAQLPDLGNPTSLGAPPEMTTAAATGSGVVAAAVARQYTAGAWLLPSQAAGMRVPQEVEETGGRGGSWSGWGTQRDGGGAAGGAAGLSLTSSLRAVWTSPPRLLWAAAAAANPSAQLVLAQLLEVSGDLGGALRWWRKLAVGGDVMGMFKTGMASYEGSHGAPCDPETAHLWLSRTVRQLLRVDSLSAIPETASRFTAAAVPAHHQHQAAGGAGEAAAERLPATVHVSTSLAALIAALDAPRVHMLGWSAMVLGYLEFDGVAGRSLWGFGERSEAVRLFRLAEGCGLAEAGAVLGWLYNTGQY